MLMESLIEYFNQLLTLDGEEIALVEQIFKPRKVKRRQFILQEGDV